MRSLRRGPVERRLVLGDRRHRRATRTVARRNPVGGAQDVRRAIALELSDQRQNTHADLSRRKGRARAAEPIARNVSHVEAIGRDDATGHLSRSRPWPPYAELPVGQNAARVRLDGKIPGGKQCAAGGQFAVGQAWINTTQRVKGSKGQRNSQAITISFPGSSFDPLIL